MNYEDEVFVVDCPAGCQDVTDKLWGTTIYTDDSYICAAAIHDGRIAGMSTYFAIIGILRCHQI